MCREAWLGVGETITINFILFPKKFLLTSLIWNVDTKARVLYTTNFRATSARVLSNEN